MWATSLHQGEARLHGGNAAASLTSKASDFILSTNRQQSEVEGFCAKEVEKFMKLCYNELVKLEFVRLQ